ncbi:hypothetical protein [Engelhardtia mirabilis]|uniref:hypothetical protein n=1 Tax=Engelhardtia mirabilis TaxID=2528011 RepID=UPI0011A648B9
MCAIALAAAYVCVKVVGWEGIGQTLGFGSGRVEIERPFELLSVTISLRQSDGIFDGQEERHLDVRTLYTIRGVQGLSATSDAMTKRYTKSDAREVRPWRGTVEEAVKSVGPTNRETIARFGIEPGEVKSLVFGSEVVFDLPFTAGDTRRAIRDIVTLGPGEAWWGYPNHHGMTIPVVTIIIESPTNDLELTGERPAFRVLADGSVDHKKASVGPPVASAGTEAIWASWRDVREDELVAFRYKWGPRK